jgi:glycosyltransferase involved in cell wall biosynthesis
MTARALLQRLGFPVTSTHRLPEVEDGMKIVFLMASEGTHPVGGHKVIYEYANGLSARGHEVHIVHCASANSRREAKTWRGRLRPLRYVRLAAQRNWKPDRWFRLNPAVKLHLVPMLSARFLPPADAYVAGWWATAESLGVMRFLPGRRLYLIQHLETWAAPEQDVMATWRAPLEKIVIARWLQKIAQDLGESSHYIPNGLDFVRFGCDVAPEERLPRRFAMLFNDRVSWKGSADGIAALNLLRNQYLDVEAEIFGEQVRPAGLPSWITYRQLPPQDELRSLYNRAAIFLAPSHAEGWPLPPAEAMTCGAAVIATDIGGHREYCIDGQTALMVPARNPEAIAEAARRMLDDQQLRVRIARNGCNHIHKFTWSRAIQAFENVLLQGEAKPVEKHADRYDDAMERVG